MNVGKTKIVKFRLGGTFSPADRAVYRDQIIDFVPEFIYLGIVLSTRLSFAAHIQHLKTNARKSVFSLISKVNLCKISFTSALRLLQSVIFPSGTYGAVIFSENPDYNQVLTQHLTSVAGFFWKKWCGISYRWPSEPLLQQLYYDDFLKVRSCNPKNRIAYFMLTDYTTSSVPQTCVTPIEVMKRVSAASVNV